MKGTLLLIALLGVMTFVFTKPAWHQIESSNYNFHSFAKEYRKNYAPHEVETRRALFESRLAQIVSHNKKNLSWKMGINHMVDWTDAELKSVLGVKKELVYLSRKDQSMNLPKSNPNIVKDLPTSVDWRTKGVVTPVKDQGQCGSCWAFAATETIESAWAISTGKLVELSEQNILDCTPNPNHCGGTGGCEGATAELAFDMVSKNGISTEWVYPYLSYGGKDYNCQRGKTTFAQVASYTQLPSNQQDPLLQAVATVGPISVSVDASAWSFYDSGVFDGCNQTQPDIDHAVQLVGYGTDSNLGDYWLVRNSWSPNWGENGYIRIKRETTPRCGIDTTPSNGSGCDGGPPTVTVCGTCGILYDSAYVVVNTN